MKFFKMGKLVTLHPEKFLLYAIYAPHHCNLGLHRRRRRMSHDRPNIHLSGVKPPSTAATGTAKELFE